ncbi:MAG: hypothetical protein H3C68_08180 [Deltaproteobacteria bacterium]|nr:hypothetical protein [Deltaproteobacteria bacterium]MBZ0219345.1 hypothetical protein [Deltaproteobacteria bacterium]
MALHPGALKEKGYITIAFSNHASIAWQGEHIKDLWMWTGQYVNGSGGKRSLQTVRVRELKEAALKYWKDGWVPLKLDSGLLLRMEGALRQHKGLKAAGVSFPEGRFLPEPSEIPDFDRKDAPEEEA